MGTKTTTSSAPAIAREIAAALNNHPSTNPFRWYRSYYRAYTKPTSLRVKDYEVMIPIMKSWISSVEERIRDSTASPSLSDHPGAEWLSPSAAAQAICFLRASADVLPSEPHLYGTSNGDVVAEFETEQGNFTGVISADMAILFGAPSKDPENPVEATIRGGSNRAREEVAEFWSKMARREDGQVESAG